MRFDSDSEDFRLTSEAYRVSRAWLFEPYSAVYSSLMEPLPHQISAVYERMLMRRPLRFVLADDPGAGKTVMTGLLIKELMIRGDVSRCLIVCPGTLVEQWQEELQQKFHVAFEILTGEQINSVDNVFVDTQRAIVGIDVLARNAAFQDKVRDCAWDLIVCDEAHKMSATVVGNKVHYTKRFRLGQLLGKITRHFLLLTATPHNGKKEDFYLFMSLVDPDRFEGVKRIKTAVDVSDIVRRLVKEDLLTFDGKPLFPERRAYTVNYSLSPNETALYEMVTAYVSDGFNRAERLSGNKKNSVGFAMTVLQRRLASSPQAIYKSLARRADRLQHLLDEKNFVDAFDPESFDEDFPSGELELAEDEFAERMTAARTLNELRDEIRTLRRLTAFAKKIFFSGEDRKWRELSDLLQDNEQIARGEKLIVFTEHRDTLDYLRQKISALFGRAESVVAIHGGMSHKDRRKVQEHFRADENVFVLVATDAAGEGINLQNAHLMINYDLPWNPNRLEQRFGRIHRIGQKNICRLWNLVAGDTREGQVFHRLLKKLEVERLALGGKVFDILGKISFDDKPLRDLLIEAVRRGNDPATVQRLDRVVDKSFDTNKLRTLLRERALTEDALGLDKVIDISQSMERGEVHKLQPYSVEKFFLPAFGKLGGQIYSRGNGRYEILRVPAALRNQHVPTSYKRVCFDKDKCAGVEPAELVSPGHPLLQSVCARLLERFGNVLRQGAVFIDDADDGNKIRLLFCLEVSIADGRAQVLAKRVHFVEVADDGQILPTGAAPYLDYSSPDAAARKKILSTIRNAPRLQADAELLAVKHAEKFFVTPLLTEVAAQKKPCLDRLEREVKSRLCSEIAYHDDRANELSAKDKLNADRERHIADELELRMNRRLDEIAAERQISAAPPVVVSCALIVPRGYLDALAEGKLNFKHADLSVCEPVYDVESVPHDKSIDRPAKVKGGASGASAATVTKNDVRAALNAPDALARARVEQIAMNAVMQIERELGNEPRDVSGDKCGYDIESREPDGKLRFIEVKGRASGASTVTVTANEIRTALNAPDNFILAIVMVDAEAAHVVYLKSPFASPPDINAVSVTYKISALVRQEKILLDRNISLGDCNEETD